MSDTLFSFVQSSLDEAAKQRHDLHVDHPTSRPLSEGYEEVGMAGEFEFGKFCGQMPDFERRPSGDKGIDFTLPVMYTVDVKTARKAGNLIHERGKRFADIYVLAEYDDTTKAATLVGWTWGITLRAAPTKDFGYGVINHYIARENLRPMSDLKRMMASFRRNE